VERNPSGGQTGGAIVDFVENVLGMAFVVTEVVLIVCTPALLVAGAIAWGVAAFRGRGRRRIALWGFAINLVLGIAWALMFAPVLLPDSISWPGWIVALASARGWAFFLTWAVALVADLVLRRRYRDVHPRVQMLPVAGRGV
jgi:hypothetical protein